MGNEPRQIKVVMCQPERKAYITSIGTELEDLQAAVGGMIELYYLSDDIFLVCNDEGKILGMPLNRAIRDDETGEIIEVIAGDFFIAKESNTEEYGFGDMSEEELNYYLNEYLYPDDIFLLGGEIMAIPFYWAS